MRSVSTQRMILWVLACATAALSSAMALAAPLMWKFTGTANDGSVLSATMTFDSNAQPTAPITSTNPIGVGPITYTFPVVTQYFPIGRLSFELRNPGPASITGTTTISSTTTIGSIVQQNVIETGISDTYRISAVFLDNQISQTATIEIRGADLFDSLLLTDVSKLQTNLPGHFSFFGIVGSPTEGEGFGITDITAIPEPWTLGLMLSGLGSIGFLSLSAIRSRRSRLTQSGVH